MSYFSILTRGACARLTHHIVALSRYENIIGSAESREIDYDSVDPGTTKPTKAAIRVNDLLETITGNKTMAKFVGNRS